MKCEDVLIFVCICLCQLAGAISYSIANPIYPFEVGILYLEEGGEGGGFFTIHIIFMSCKRLHVGLIIQ